MDGEIWKNILGAPYYEVSNLGRARSLSRNIPTTHYSGKKIIRPHKGKILKRSKNNSGYLTIGARIPGKEFLKFMVHRAVWEAFNGPIPAGLWVNHKNNIRTDNRLANLELLTPQENVIYGIKQGRYKTNQGRIMLTAEDVRFIRLCYKYKVKGMVKLLCKRFNLDRHSITNAAMGRCHKFVD